MLDADEVIRRWMEKRDKIFTDGKKPQNYQSQKHYIKGIENCLKILWLRSPSEVDIQKIMTFLESIIAETREMFRPDGMIEFYQSQEFWEMLENYTKKVEDNKK